MLDKTIYVVVYKDGYCSRGVTRHEALGMVSLWGGSMHEKWAPAYMLRIKLK